MNSPAPRNRYLVPGLIALALSIAALYLSTQLEVGEETVRTRMRGEAARDPNLALRQMLEKLGYRTQTRSDPSQFARLPPHTTLFMSELLSAPVARHVEPAVVQWVRAGGHLVVIIPGEGQTDRFVASLGIQRLGLHRSEQATTSLQLEGQTLRLHSRGCDLFRLETPPLWSGALQGYQRYQSELPLADTDADEAPAAEPSDAAPRAAHGKVDASGLAVARWRLGRGLVSALCDNRPLLNDAIGEHDHAALAARVLIAEGYDTVVFTPRAAYPDLIEWLFARAPWVFLATALLLLACLWAAMPRFGPIRREAPAQRPGLATHLAAVADFHLRRRAWPLLASALRDEVLRLLRKRHGNPSVEHFAAEAQLPELAQALDAEASSDAARFRHHASTLARALDALRAQPPLANRHSAARKPSP